MENEQTEPLEQSGGATDVFRSADPAPPPAPERNAQVEVEGSSVESDDGLEVDGETVPAANRKRRRGSRGGRNRKRPALDGGDDGDDVGEAVEDGSDDASDDSDGELVPTAEDRSNGAPAEARAPRRPSNDLRPELPERISEGRPSSVEAADQGVRFCFGDSESKASFVSFCRNLGLPFADA